MANIGIYKLTTVKKKNDNIIIRVSPDVHDEFRAAAAVKGATKSGLIHQFIFKTIREAKAEDPAKFEEELRAVKLETVEPPIFTPEDAAKFNSEVIPIFTKGAANHFGADTLEDAEAKAKAFEEKEKQIKDRQEQPVKKNGKKIA